MKVGDRQPEPDDYFVIIPKEGTDDVRFIDCKLCGAHVFDSTADELLPHDAVTQGLIAHLEFSHNEVLGPGGGR
jgi:hypothetical protein